MQDEKYMARAMKLAQRGRFTTHPNPNVGCVIVKDGEIVGKGFTIAQASRMLKCMPCVWRGESARRDGLRDAGALQPPRAHAAVL